MTDQAILQTYLALDPLEEFHPKLRDCRFWFDIFNDMVFEGKLKRFRKIRIIKFKDKLCYGWCKGYTTKARGRNYCTLEIRDSLPSFGIFLSVMLHEMIHSFQWQFLNHITHGKTFKALAKASLKKIPLPVVPIIPAEWRPEWIKQGSEK